MSLKVALAGGGTAGHVNPLLATAHLLSERGHEVHVIGTGEGLEATMVPEAGFPLTKIPKAPMPRSLSPQAFLVPSKLRAAFTISRKTLRGMDALIGFGGYVSAPAYIAAASLGLPYVVQEQNVMPGVANKLGARWANAVSLAFPQTPLKARKGATEFTGMPLRRQIVELGAERETPEGRRSARLYAAQELGLDPELPTLLVMGGSLGALHLNQVLAEGAKQGVLDGHPSMQILHLAGRGKAEEVIAATEYAPYVLWQVREYLEEMDLALSVADLVVCRSGAGTVSELGVLGLPAVYVPLPIGNGEQVRNAEGQIEAGGAVAVNDADFNISTLSKVVFPLLFDPSKLQKMGDANRGTSPRDGARLLADLLEESVA